AWVSLLRVARRWPQAVHELGAGLELSVQHERADLSAQADGPGRRAIARSPSPRPVAPATTLIRSAAPLMACARKIPRRDTAAARGPGGGSTQTQAARGADAEVE